MSGAAHDLFFSAFVRDLETSAVKSHQVPKTIASQAAAATMRALGANPDTESLRYRAKAYFWKVVRTSCGKSPEAAEARGYFLLAAVVADLERGGWCPGQVWDEIQRGWADRVPGSVLEEYRRRLCA